jgi:hypothetical protein
MSSLKSDDEMRFNTKQKIYPKQIKITICNKSVFKFKGPETFLKGNNKKIIKKPKNMNNFSRYDNIRRAKDKVFDIASLNDFTHFITWTLDKQLIDRYNAKEVSKKLKFFLSNKRYRNGLAYLIIPERHKDGAIHMHGLIKGNMKFIDSGQKTENGKTIYNMPEWKYGYSEAVELNGESNIIAKYITKYIGKGKRKIFGNYYYAGGNIQRNPDVILCNTDYDELDSIKEYGFPELDLWYKYFTAER